MWYTYVLLCEDGSLYTGSSTDIDKRFLTHKSGKGGRYTRAHKPIRILYREEFSTQSEALKRESQIKSWPREKKIKVLRLEI